jgi:hypothetical protein
MQLGIWVIIKAATIKPQVSWVHIGQNFMEENVYLVKRKLY